MADMKLSVDSSELDAALEKAARLSAMLDEIGGRFASLDDVAGDTVFEEIIEIETLEPTDTPFMYGIHIAI